MCDYFLHHLATQYFQFMISLSLSLSECLFFVEHNKDNQRA